MLCFMHSISLPSPEKNMSQKTKQQNINAFKNWLDPKLKGEEWSTFKIFAHRKTLSRAKIAKACGVDGNAFKADKGNPTVLAMFYKLEKTLQKKLPNFFEANISSEEKYHNYVENLEQSRGKFPVDEDNDIDFIRLSKEIGIPTSRLTSNKFQKLLNDDVKRIGTELLVGKSVEESMQGEILKMGKELNKCKQDLAIAEEVIEGLKNEKLKLHRIVNKLESEGAKGLQHMIETGRRSTL